MRSGAKLRVIWIVLLQDWLASGLDSGCGIHGGFHRLQAGLRSPGYPPRSPPAKCLFYCVIYGLQGWLPEGVASQKNRSDAGDMPRCAPPYTNGAGEEPCQGGSAQSRLPATVQCCVAAFTLRPFMHSAAFFWLKRQSTGQSCRSQRTRSMLPVCPKVDI